MDLRQGSKISLLTQLGIAYALVPGAAANWTLSLPTALTGDADGMNTRIKLTALGTQPTYTKLRTFRYKRIDLADLKRVLPPRVSTSLSGVTSTYGAFAYLLKTYGILFDAQDLEDVATTTNADGSLRITLTAKSTCILWTGTCFVDTGGLPDISTAIKPAYFEWS